MPQKLFSFFFSFFIAVPKLFLNGTLPTWHETAQNHGFTEGLEAGQKISERFRDCNTKISYSMLPVQLFIY